jgi:four helix bundle protein
MKLVEMIYRRTVNFPREETYGLASQMRRAAVSVPSNIAEGAARNTTRELVQYLGVASGSLAELETELELAARLGLGTVDSECVTQVSRVGKLLVGLRNSLRERLN